MLTPLYVQGVTSSALYNICNVIYTTDSTLSPTQPQPLSPNHLTHSHDHTLILSYFIISAHDTPTAQAHGTRWLLSPYIYYISIILSIYYHLSYLTLYNSYTRATISKRKPTARPDTLIRYIYYLSYKAEAMERIFNMSIHVTLCRMA